MPRGVRPLPANAGLAADTPGATGCPTARDLTWLPPGGPVAHHHATALVHKYRRRKQHRQLDPAPPTVQALARVHTNDTITQNILIRGLVRREHGPCAPPLTAAW